MATSAKRHPLTTKFEIPEDTHTVLVVVPHFWGRGKTKAEAMKQVKRQGGEPGKTGYVAYYFGKGFEKDTGWVTNMGYIHWEFDSDETANLPTKDQPQPVKETVGLD